MKRLSLLVFVLNSTKHFIIHVLQLELKDVLSCDEYIKER